MSKKVSMGSPCAGWSDLPAELLAIISDGLEERTDVTRFRGVCQSWRSSVKPSPNKLSPFFPHHLSSGCLGPYSKYDPPNYIIANAIYLVKHKRNPKASTFMISLREDEAGKLLLRHAHTYHPITYSIIGSSLDPDSSRWSLTRIAISHSFQSIPNNNHYWSETKLVLVEDPDFPSEAMALFYHTGFMNPGRMYALRRCLSSSAHTQLVAGVNSHIIDIVNFNGCIYAIDDAVHFYVLDHTTSTTALQLQLLRLTCVNFPGCPLWKPKSLVVSDGDLFLVLTVLVANENQWHVYKMVMDDLNAKCYHLIKVSDLGDRVFFINWDCSFSVSTRDLPLLPKFVGNYIFVARGCYSNRYCIYHVGGGLSLDHIRGRRSRKVPPYSALFKLPSQWMDQLQQERKMTLPLLPWPRISSRGK